MPEGSANSLNSNHERRLSVTCRYIDKLLADMESMLSVSSSRLAFPQYIPDLTSAQRRVVEDYIGRIRAQLIRVLDGQSIERPSADIPVGRSLHSTLTFVDIAVEELKPEYMRGYGEVPPQAAVELNGITGELQGLVRQLDHYLIRGTGENLQERLERLEQTGDEVSLLRKLETVITEHGLVEFRSTLSMILDRLEDNSFEIAMFGRVSSGKSSLLNAILETDVLPVGVTPITAVPTRLAFAESPSVNVWFANRSPERYEISLLPEFVAEQLNPGNEKHVTRIVVQLGSPRLRDGITFVDTPGLGSLATRGAAETLAYLPRCDLGVVLIDAGSTLTPDDLQTIQILYDAAIPATVLLSKADLLTAQERSRVIGYVKDHIRKELNVDLAIHAVSVVRESKELLTRWFEDDIAPLYSQRQDLKMRSIRRKLGALRQSVEIALRGRLRRKDQIPIKKLERLRVLEAELRQASGRLEEMKRTARRAADDLEYSSCRKMLQIAAANQTSVSQVLIKGACPICGILKNFQWTLAAIVRPQAALQLCNFHTWALARSRGGSLERSTPRESVSSVFLEMLSGFSSGKVSSDDCALCHRVREEEVIRLRELAEQFQRPMFVHWMKRQGSLCLDHAGKLKEFVPLRLRTLIDEVVERNRAELREELEAFHEQLRQGVHAGGGLLGRVAEFLVGQREL